MIERLCDEEFDVVVIGGGVTGAGVALDAASRGLRTALIERDDLASGTSSRSSKLVHGGLRYLQNGDLRLVYQALHERHRLLRNAPHLVRPLPFVIPILNRDGLISRRVARALGGALWMYDMTGGWRIGRRHRRLDARDVLEHIPSLNADRVAGGYLYYDATVDDARLTLMLARTAADHGAVVVTRCVATGLLRNDDGAISGVEAALGPDVGANHGPGRQIIIRTRAVVSATGVWADEIRTMMTPDAAPLLRPARGVHITVPWDLIRNRAAVVIPVPGDRRSLFVIPWDDLGDGTHRFAYVGTTDTDHVGTLDQPACTGDDIDYILRALNRAVSSPETPTPITPDDITAVWSGLRPLVAAADSERTADLSRRHSIEVDPSGLVNIAGGKLTTYREMAEDTVDAVVSILGLRPWRHRCRTRRLALHGARGSRRWQRVVTAPIEQDRLERRYGTDTDRIVTLVDHDRSLGEPLVPGLGYLRAEAVHAVTDEMALTLTDVLVRRTQAHYQDRLASAQAAPQVAALMAPLLGWDAAETDRQVRDYQRLCDTERDAAIEFAPVAAASVARTATETDDTSPTS